MRLIHRLRAAIDVILGFWPTAMGGHSLRYFFGKVVLHIAGGVYFGDQLIIAGFPAIQIGEGTSIMRRSYLYAHESSNLIIGSRCSFNHNVWLAANVAVTSGVTIGNGCVICAGSIVTRDLPPLSVCVGNQARVIRSRLQKVIGQSDEV